MAAAWTTLTSRCKPCVADLTEARRGPHCACQARDVFVVGRWESGVSVRYIPLRFCCDDLPQEGDIIESAIVINADFDSDCRPGTCLCVHRGMPYLDEKAGATWGLLENFARML
jgi:hypothetical protein